MKWLPPLVLISFTVTIQLIAQVNPKLPNWINKIEIRKDAIIDKAR